MKNKTKHIGITAIIACLLAIGMFFLIGCATYKPSINMELGDSCFEKGDYGEAILYYNEILNGEELQYDNSNHRITIFYDESHVWMYPTPAEIKIAREKLAEAQRRQGDPLDPASYDDPAMAAIIARTNSASTRTNSQNGNVLNDLAWRDEWVKLFDDARKLIQAHPPVIAKVIYDPTPKQGKTDYNKRTVDFECTIDVKGVPYPPGYVKMVRELNAKLFATGQNGDQRRFESGYSSYKNFDKGWDIYPLSLKNIWGRDYVAGIDYTAELVNKAGKAIARTSEGVEEDNQDGSTYSNIGLGYMYFGDNGTKPVLRRDIYNPFYREDLYIRNPTPLEWPITVRLTAKADDITDQMTVRVSVNRVYSRKEMWGVNPDFSKYPVEVMTTATDKR